ncbi:MAG TPA: tetrahydrofolate dehydrogenase/cyclohydrolase catalytic domain-containing protein, partial [Pseudomonadota bacterium]|nr:tetrahydrofolate dehydrogenase/cyclohydrolase catalytic domain-containing protein [Pseudomonadota bacterium]
MRAFAGGPMAARVLDGKRIADEVLDGIGQRVRARIQRGQRRPGLAVVLVGADPASSVYVRNKRRAC